MKKHEYRKHEKQFYLPKGPEHLIVPPFKFVTISGEGNPNSPTFSECITALYSISYAIKMNLKKMENKPRSYCDYTVYPLEGIWDVSDKAKKEKHTKLNKDELVYKIMIRQPDFVSKALFEEMLELTKHKKPQPRLDALKFETIEDGPCIQMMHIGSFDDEPVSFKKMEAFAQANNLRRTSKKHREIYLSDFRKVETARLKTVLRFAVK